MCDPITLIGLAIGGISAMMMASQEMPEPPPAATPAIPAPLSRNPGATVRLGAGEDDITNNLSVEDPGKLAAPAPQRTTGNPLGNLGRSALQI